MRFPFLIALKDSLPAFFAYFPLGIVFGVLFTSQLDLPWIMAPLMSLITLAGAIQFVALGIFAANGSLIGLFITSFFVAMRNSFYGLSLLHRFERASFWPRQYLIYGLVDATYSIIHNRKEREEEVPYLFHLTWIIHFHWVAGTFIGALFGKEAFQLPGLEFASAALFTVFFIDQWKKSKNLSIVIVALLSFGIASILLPNQALIFGIIASFFYLCLRHFFTKRKKPCP